MSDMREVSLGEGFGDVAVSVNGIRVELHGDGAIVAHASGDIDVYTDAAVRVHPARHEPIKAASVTPAALKPGDPMEDGTIYAGISPDTNRPMYTTPVGAPLTY